ncbi:GCG_CRPN prefix-to-repeats domain-containing protein [Legionella cardiaca]|uniref:Transmembrane protein n=1 Tax=Legionella cardiaca TaxID=1071983 RepID=A0ABY8AVV3_9GAMM|nr:hypothetical protein [Legionella cardiaca]WED44579.1 hypothetical protein PXX05_07265 [Legionella cardiaca]
MKTHSISISRLIAPLVIGGLLTFGICYSSITNAAQGCGFGYHMTAFGRCVPNHPGPNATPAPGRPDCWYNGAGQLRCWR